MSMNISISILYVAHPLHNMPQLLGRKFFRQFFHLPLTGLDIDDISDVELDGNDELDLDWVHNGDDLG